MTRAQAPATSSNPYEDDELFHTVMFGYDRAEVDQYVDALCDELRVLAAAVQHLTPLDEELQREHDEVERLRTELAEATSSAAISVRMQQILRLAEDEAGVLRDQARAILDRARSDADQIRRTAYMDGENAAAARVRENQAAHDRIVAAAKIEAARIIAEVSPTVNAAKPARKRASAAPTLTADAEKPTAKRGQRKRASSTTTPQPEV